MTIFVTNPEYGIHNQEIWSFSHFCRKLSFSVK
jgi:hypothetical protein